MNKDVVLGRGSSSLGSSVHNTASNPSRTEKHVSWGREGCQQVQGIQKTEKMPRVEFDKELFLSVGFSLEMRKILRNKKDNTPS